MLLFCVVSVACSFFWYIWYCCMLFHYYISVSFHCCFMLLFLLLYVACCMLMDCVTSLVFCGVILICRMILFVCYSCFCILWLILIVTASMTE